SFILRKFVHSSPERIIPASQTHPDHALLSVLNTKGEFFLIYHAKQLKNWHSSWKWNLVRQYNPKLEDWYETLRH
ncbi:MAG: hypothetical protein ABJ356_00765, partial [Balneola sp.]